MRPCLVERSKLQGKNILHKKCDAILFAADTEYGRIGMEIYHKRELYFDATINAAIVLGSEEKLIQNLEDWLKTTLDFRPVSKLNFVDSVSVDLAPPKKIDDISDQEQSSVCLFLPISLLKLVSPPNWFSLQVNWQEIETTLRLAQFKLTTSELKDLEKGAVLLIPNSFDDDWMVSIQSTQAELNTVLNADCILNYSLGHLDILGDKPMDNQHHQSIVVEQFEEDMDNQEEALMEVYFKHSLCSPADFLMGWMKDETSVFPIQFKNKESSIGMEEQVLIKRNNLPFAEGHLIPAASGYGALITHICN